MPISLRSSSSASEFSLIFLQLFGCLLACLFFFVFCFSQVAVAHVVLFFSSYSNFFAPHHLSFALSPFWKSGEGEKVVVVVVVVVGMISSFVCSRCGKEEEEEEEEEKIVRLFKLCFSFVGLCFCLLSVF
jgi:hypothetical protein